MRKPKGKLVALLAGAVVVPLLTLAVLFWKDVYCHLYLDPRLVGRWERAPVAPPLFLEFDRVGNMEFQQDQESRVRGRYRVDGKELTLFSDGKPVWEDHFVVLMVDVDSYRIVGDTWTFDSPRVARGTYRRVPDDS